MGKGFRISLLIVVFVLIGAGLIYRLFELQIVNGEQYLDNFQLKIRKEISISVTRGNIYDRNGNLLASNKLAYAVTIKDTYDGDDEKLNSTISKSIDIVESNGDSITTDFNITSGSGDKYAFNVDGQALLRFLADIYGYTSTDDLKYEEKTKTADEVIADLCQRYGIGEYEDPENKKSTYISGKGYTDDPVKLLKMVIIRYKLSLNSYQKYISTTIASDVSDRTVADILESADTLQGVSIEDSTIRQYTDSKYFAQILGYTGTVSTDELTQLQADNPDLNYDSNDIVGKSGIEKSMEAELQGHKGSETVYVDNFGTILEVTDRTEPSAGNDVYLTIDKDLTEAAYDILESQLAKIILAKLRNVKECITDENTNSSDIFTPIYDVYYAVFNNNLIDIDHLYSTDAGANEKAVSVAFDQYMSEVWDKLDDEYFTTQTPYKELSREYENYQTYIVQYLYDEGIINKDLIDTEDETYVKWTTDETISMSEYIRYAISAGWVDVTDLDLGSTYSDSDTVYDAIFKYIKANLIDENGFVRKVYKYVILNDRISGNQVCQILLEQNIVNIPPMEEAQFESGSESSYQFMYNRISNLDLTPAELSLYPYSGSMVITDVNNGNVLAMVTYPSYDNNKMANGVDADYYAELRSDLSSPLINYATQQRTAPGSTFKMVTSTAGLMEGVIDLSTQITCTGVFEKIGDPAPKCWIYPGSHGNLNVTGAITNSCNDFFYEVGYRLATKQDSLTGNNVYDSDTGIAKIDKYIDMYGLSDTSGVEIDEASPQLSDQDSVRTAIGQGNSGYTTTQLARYITTVANSGTCYDLTLIDCVKDTDGTIISDNSATIRNVIDMPSSYWDAIHAGMRGVVENKSYFEDLSVHVAGKTGTAQENTSKPNHALFLCYAPYEDPQISVATRIANGYSSDYAAKLACSVLKYYYGDDTYKNLTSTGTDDSGVTIGGD
ncbi:MAG: penicillin-binding transpeptidase domain-containing protein [Lachnospiraceae bacterium]|nr:penicillin-binding transpeptidase domain-containing protein [Lachnospiraceae bacterium]